MSVLLGSALIVAVAEIGDKTQLLSLLLAVRFRRPVPIVLGILVATLANHAAAAWVGDRIAAALGATTLNWLLGASFVALGLWALRADTLDMRVPDAHRSGVFLIAALLFFVAEIGDKTQLATVALAARHGVFADVVVGTTLGMLIANVPVVLLGERFMRRLPLRWIRYGAAGLFTATGAAVLVFGTGAS